MSLRICNLGTGKCEEKKEERASELATHGYKMVPDWVARLPKKWEAGSFGQSCLSLAGKDDGSGHVGLLRSLFHIGRSEQGTGRMIVTTLSKGKRKRQQKDVEKQL